MKRLIQLIVFIYFPYLVIAQDITLNWLDNDVIYVGENSISVLSFEGAKYINGSFLPYYIYSKKLSTQEAENYEYEVSISQLKTSYLSDTDCINTAYIENDFQIISSVSSSRKDYLLEIIILPFKYDNGQIVRLESFQFNITSTPVVKLKSTSSWFADNSVLSTGNWIKVSVDKTGIYKLTYDALSEMGVTPEDVSIFTGSPGKLSKIISNYVDDLKEIPIYVSKGTDGVFNSGDYILFYGQGPDVWNYNSSSQKYIHTQHPFWNKNNYFITSDVGEKKRISEANSVSGTSTLTYNTFVDYDFVEPEECSLTNSGDDWYSNKIYNGESFSHTFSFDNVVKESSIFTMKLLARSVEYSHTMTTYINDEFQEDISLEEVKDDDVSEIANETVKNYSFIPKSDDIEAKMTFICEENSAVALVDYFRIQIKRYLIFNDSSLIFRNEPTSDTVVTYQLSDADLASLVWDITDAFDVKSINVTIGDTLTFNATGDETKEFVAINPSYNFLSPTIVEKIDNQNIHGRDIPDMVIVTCADFEEIANEIAEIHSDLDVYVVDQQKIFNEFSGGKADVTAIRWMCKMFYDRSTDDKELKYLLLLGDADLNNRLYEDESSLVMTYESEESLNQSETYMSDDYFGLLDDNEGSSIAYTDKLDIGIGRIPITSVSEGDIVVNKIKTYINNKKRTTWKNRLCFVADDENENEHVENADKLAEKVRKEYEAFAVKKVYIDAFTQITKADGDYYPDAKALSDKYIEEGVLIWDYTGHGSPTALTGENIMNISDINSFENIANLPFWVTASCDFCAFDNHEEISSGERVLLNSSGGGIALLTTTRMVYSDANYEICYYFYNYVFDSDTVTNEKWRLGDIVRLAKNATNSSINKRKYCLIGDPALRLIYPDERWSVETDSINNQYVDKNDNSFTDTLKSLSTATISGYIKKSDGTVDTDFNGTLFTTIYDKISELETLGNDDTSSPIDFVMWNSVLFNGQTTISNGRFNFSFIVPKDIDYNVGNGRIEYYATSDDIEANGFYEDFNIGGFNSNFEKDTLGPEIDLYMNSTSFKDGDEVNSDPTLIAYISDASGITTSDNSFGHHITIKLNNDASTIESINSSYSTNSESYTSGTVNYQLSDLEEGEYTLTFKIWDVQNNSSTKDITFVVNDDAIPEIEAVYCSPNPVLLSSNDNVRFIVQHDRPESTLSIDFGIYDSEGKIVYNTSQYSYSSSNEVYFDWTPSATELLPGLYFYRITIDDGENVSKAKLKKLLIKP